MKVKRIGNVSKDEDRQGGYVYNSCGLSPTICAGTHGYAMGFVLVEEKMRVRQVGNIVGRAKWENPQTGRVYSPEGISPTITTCGG